MDTKLFEEKHKELLPVINIAWDMIDSADDVTLESWYEAIDYLLTNVSNRLDGVVKPQGVETEEITKEIFGEWKLISKIERRCINCNNNLYSAEIKNILHGHQRATICTTCKTIHIQDRVWNGK